MLPWVVCFCAPGGAGKTTQAVLLVCSLERIGRRARCIDTFEHLIKPEIYPEDLPDKEYVFSLFTVEGEQRTTRKTERAINKSGALNTPSWVSWLTCSAMRDSLEHGECPIFPGSPRSILEAKEFAEALERSRRDGLVSGLFVVRIEIALNIVRQRLRARAEALPSEERERLQYKIDKMPKRLAEFREQTLPAFALLQKAVSLPQGQLTVVDRGSRTPEQIQRSIFQRLVAAARFGVANGDERERRRSDARGQ